MTKCSVNPALYYKKVVSPLQPYNNYYKYFTLNNENNLCFS